MALWCRKRGFKWALLMAIVAGGLGQIAQGQEAEEKQSKLPIRRVVMFTSGVAFLEHRGKVTGNTSVDLQFNVDNINDLLKSMVVQDLSNGRITAVSYGSRDPITRTLQTFAIDLTDNPTLADLLNQVRGERVEVHAPTPITGTIVGVEMRPHPVGDDDEKVVERPYLNLLTDEGLQSVSLQTVGRIKLLDEQLNRELQQALAVLAMGHDTDQKTVTLRCQGEGERDVRVGYIQEAPVWKTSYRIVLQDEDSAMLQGWAIVENTSDTDWENVNLTLVSGRPISFVMDLYEPLYVDRPVVQMELYSSLRPRVHERDLYARDEPAAAIGQAYGAPAGPPQEAMSKRMLAGGMGGGMGGVAAEMSDRAAGSEARWNLQQGVQAVAQAADLGELFRYDIDTPVKLERNRSAMLPIVNQAIEAKKVLIYNESVHGKHPLNGVRLKNNTDLHLMQGPMTVFDDDAYAGDARINDLGPGADQLISYALELDVEVAPRAEDHPRRLVSARLVKGTLYTNYRLTRAKTYVVKSSEADNRTVLVEHPIQQGWELLEPQKPEDETRNYYRFQVEAEAGKTKELVVREQHPLQEAIEVTNLPYEAIRIYLGSTEVSDAVKQALQEVVRRKSEIDKLNSELNQLQQQVNTIDQEQNRIRQNMAQLPRDSELFRRYVSKFSEQEDQMENLREQMQSLSEQIQQKQQELNDYLVNLEVE